MYRYVETCAWNTHHVYVNALVCYIHFIATVFLKTNGTCSDSEWSVGSIIRYNARQVIIGFLVLLNGRWPKITWRIVMYNRLYKFTKSSIFRLEKRETGVQIGLSRATSHIIQIIGRACRDEEMLRIGRAETPKIIIYRRKDGKSILPQRILDRPQRTWAIRRSVGD